MKHMRTLLLLFFLYGNGAEALNICFLVNVFPYANQMYIINQITGLIDRGHTVTVLSRKRYHESYSDALLPYQDRFHLFYHELPSDKTKYDVILCQMADLGKWLLSLKKNGLEGKSVIFGRGGDISSALMRDAHCYDELFAKTDLWLPVCDYFKDVLVSCGLDSKKIKVLSSAIDTTKFTPKASRADQEQSCKQNILLVTTARLTDTKGLEYSLRAVAVLARRYPTIRYSIIGKGRSERHLKLLAQQLGIQDKVIFMGQQSHEKVIELLQRADIYIQPSVTTVKNNKEGIPNALKEAMSMELPVISTRHSGIPELVEDEVSGLLVPERDPEAICDAVVRLIENKKLRDTLGSMAHKKVVECFDIEVLGDKLHALLVSLCS